MKYIIDVLDFPLVPRSLTRSFFKRNFVTTIRQEPRTHCWNITSQYGIPWTLESEENAPGGWEILGQLCPIRVRRLILHPRRGGDSVRTEGSAGFGLGRRPVVLNHKYPGDTLQKIPYRCSRSTVRWSSDPFVKREDMERPTGHGITDRG